MIRPFLTPFFVLLVVVGCASADLTPRQSVLDIASKYEALQIVAEQAVTTPGLDENVKNAIKAADKVAVTALERYRAEVDMGITDEQRLAAVLASVNAALLTLANELIVHGFLGSTEEVNL